MAPAQASWSSEDGRRPDASVGPTALGHDDDMPGPPPVCHCTCGLSNCGYGRIMARTTPPGAVARGMLVGAAGALAMDALPYRRAGGEERSLPGGRRPPSRTGRTLRLRCRPAAGWWRACSRARCPPGGPGRSATPPTGRTAHARVRSTACSPDRRRGAGRPRHPLRCRPAVGRLRRPARGLPRSADLRLRPSAPGQRSDCPPAPWPHRHTLHHPPAGGSFPAWPRRRGRGAGLPHG